MVFVVICSFCCVESIEVRFMITTRARGGEVGFCQSWNHWPRDQTGLPESIFKDIVMEVERFTFSFLYKLGAEFKEPFKFSG